ncbi:hypothetical protein [Arachidicoccus soli]|uniref:DUF1735 domain-containing protein n=1 Tax=Arachidicoccus soli TaxID=2341117 RepID=A0A386HRW9_9BACT|nr:hypothetical protein [Arachidicoccus soli]AYD48432.1 hypothetical protein D6B99_12960 [Arachidicoccus soli]
MKKSTFYLFVVLIAVGALAVVSCSKNNAFVKPAPMAQFGGAMLNLAFENNLPSGVYPIPLGLTASSKNDVTVSISVFRLQVQRTVKNIH